MFAEAKSLRFLGEGKQLTVPFFQRRYVWEMSNWEELLATFQNKEVMPFLGSIILKEDSSVEKYIIDGQQRLTTITILAKVIFDCVSCDCKQSGSGIRNCVENFLFYRRNAADSFSDSIVRIKHSRIDQADYNLVIESGMIHGVPQIDISSIDESSGNALRCYKFFYGRLKDKGDDYLKELFNSIFDQDRKVFVLIELEYGDINEQTIFDTINRAGMRLSTADIIKNNLFKKLLDAAGTDEVRKNSVNTLYDSCWDNMFCIDQSTSELWDEERVFGNIKHNNLEFLLYCVACIKWGEDGDMFSKLENVFDRETEKMGFSELQHLVTEIKDYAKLFKEYVLDFKSQVEDEYNNIYFSYKDGVHRLLLILQKFGIQMFYPFVLKRIMESVPDNSDSMLEDFHILESFIVRRKLSNRGTHDYTSKCYMIIKNGIQSLIESDLGVESAGIGDGSIKQYLNYTKDDTAKMILFWIELYRRRQPMFDITGLEYRYTLEHIMPKKWERNWKTVPIVDNGNVLSWETEEGKTVRNSMIQALGNKTLLTSGLNSTVKNASFMQKIMGVGDNKPGYKSHTSLLVTKELVDSAETDPLWDEAHIAERTKSLYEEFIKIWPSFKERVTVNAPEVVEQASDISRYTEEQLADPLLLLEAMNEQSCSSVEANNFTVNDFIRMVNVQTETVHRYVREGLIIPDYVLSEDQGGTKLFKKETIYKYAQQFGWTIINDENRKEIFLKMIRQMDMSYSYKPVLIMNLFECVDESGKCGMPDLVTHFMRFYKGRIENGCKAEKDDSVLSRKDCSYEDAERVVLIYPFRRFADIGVLRYERERNLVSISESVWGKLSEEEKTEIVDKCRQKISEYYSRL